MTRCCTAFRAVWIAGNNGDSGAEQLSRPRGKAGPVVLVTPTFMGRSAFEEEAVLEAAGTETRRIVLVLDQLSDPHNVGAILRTAAAFGATAERVSCAATVSGSAKALEPGRRADAAGAPRVVPFGP